MGMVPGLLSQSATAVAVAEIMQGGLWSRIRFVMDVAISCISAGMSCKNLSIAQSDVLQVVSDLLHRSLR